MDSDCSVLAWDDPSPLQITFHRTTRVGDHEDPSKQTVATAVDHSPPCKLTRWPPDGDEKTYLLALDCPAGRALSELDAFGICAWTDGPSEAGVKLEVKVEGENVAFPPLSRWEYPPAPATRPQDYFFLSSTESKVGEEWIHGIAVKEEPRLVRQFVVRNDGTGASIQHQVTGAVVPEKMDVVEIEVTFAPRSSEIIPVSPTASSSLRSSRESQEASYMVQPELRPTSPAQTQSGPFPFPVEPPCNTTHTDPQPPRATPSPSPSLFGLPHMGSTASLDEPALPPPSPSLSSCLDWPHMSSPASLDEPALPRTASFDEPALPPTASLDELTLPALPVERYYLFIRVGRSFTIQQENGTGKTVKVVELLRFDNVESDIDTRTLKHLVSERIRRDLALGPGQTAVLKDYDYDPLAIDSFDLACEGQFLDEFHFLEDYHVYPGCTLVVIYRKPAGYGHSLESIMQNPHTGLDYDFGFASTPAYDIELSDFDQDSRPEPLILGPPISGSRMDESTADEDRVSSLLSRPHFDKGRRRQAPPLKKKPPLYGSRRYGLLTDKSLVEAKLGTGKLEILPGGLVAQPLSKDPGTYDWASQPRAKIAVRIVNFEQFRSITGMKPPTAPQLHLWSPLSRRDERNLGGMDTMLASNAEYQLKYQVPGDELGTSSIPSGGNKSMFPEKGGTRKPNEGGSEALQLPTTNLAVIHPVPDRPRRKGATLHPADAFPSHGVSRLTNNDTTGHMASTEGSSGGSLPNNSTSEVTMGKREVSGSRKMRANNCNSEKRSGICNCCTCM